MPTSVNVVVVGAGPVGLTAGLLLARDGVTVRIPLRDLAGSTGRQSRSGRYRAVRLAAGSPSGVGSVR